MRDKSLRGKGEIIQREGRIHYDKGQVREMATELHSWKQRPAENSTCSQAVCSALGWNWGRLRGRSQSLRRWAFCFRLRAGFMQGVQRGEEHGWCQLWSEGPHPAWGAGTLWNLPGNELLHPVGPRMAGGQESSGALLCYFLPITCQVLFFTFLFECNGKRVNFTMECLQHLSSFPPELVPNQFKVNLPAAKLTKSPFLQSLSASSLQGSIALSPQSPQSRE